MSHLNVALRILHSRVHCTSNRVKHRFRAFAASSAVLLGMWIAFTVQRVQAA